MCATNPAHIMVLDFIILIILAKSTSCEAPHYAIFSNAVLFHPSSIQIFSSAPFLQIHVVSVIPLMSETKFHAQTKVQEKL
jgi:hypothetical protein